MKITCGQQDLKRALSQVGRAVPAHSSTPLLTRILLSSDEGGVRLYATNSEISITCLMKAETHEEGAIALPASLFKEYIDSLAVGTHIELTVAQGTGKAHILSSGSSATIIGVDAALFPPRESRGPDDKMVILEAAPLKEVLDHVIFAASRDISTPVLAGVSMQICRGRATFSATDKFRLAVESAPLIDSSVDYPKIIIPAQALSILLHLLPACENVSMTVTSESRQVIFQCDGVELCSLLISGNYPDLQKIILQDTLTRVSVNTDEFLASLKSVAPFAPDTNNITQIKITKGEGAESEKGALTVEAAEELIGNNVSSIDARVEGTEQQFFCNHKYLYEVLTRVSEQEVVLELTSAAKPVVLKIASPRDFTYVVMPLSIQR